MQGYSRWRRLVPAIAQQEAHPARPVKIIVPFPGGGATDYIARYVGEKLSQRLGKAVIVENRNGAGGMLGIDAALKSPADGYTLLVTSATYAVLLSLMKLTYDPVRDTAPVINYGDRSRWWSRSTAQPVPTESLKELVTYAQANPGQAGVRVQRHRQYGPMCLPKRSWPIRIPRWFTCRTRASGRQLATWSAGRYRCCLPILVRSTSL